MLCQMLGEELVLPASTVLTLSIGNIGLAFTTWGRLFEARLAQTVDKPQLNDTLMHPVNE